MQIDETAPKAGRAWEQMYMKSVRHHESVQRKEERPDQPVKYKNGVSLTRTGDQLNDGRRTSWSF